MTLHERALAYGRAFLRWPASMPWVVSEQGHDVLYAVWVIGNDYRGRAGFYGEYPPGFVARVLALFPDVEPGSVLHVFSGSLRPGHGVRVDCDAANSPDVVGSAYDLPSLLPGRRFMLAMADPPYSRADAERYGTPPVDRGRVMRALAHVVAPGGHVAWLDTCWPMHRKAEWLTVGRIMVQRSTNHRVRTATIFKRRDGDERSSAAAGA